MATIWAQFQGMTRIVCIIACAVLAVPVAAQDLGASCRIERLDQARAACLGALADSQEMRTDAYIAQATSDLQAASAKELATFEAGLARSQNRWRDASREQCRAVHIDEPGFQACRLRAATDRDAEVRETLAEARLALGAPAPIIDVPDSVEILIPLPDLPAGPDTDVRVPLVIPIRP